MASSRLRKEARAPRIVCHNLNVYNGWKAAIRVSASHHPTTRRRRQRRTQWQGSNQHARSNERLFGDTPGAPFGGETLRASSA